MSMTNNTTADTTASGAGEGGEAVEAVAWVNPLDVDCLAFEDGHTWPSIYRHETDGYSAPLYSQATVDTLRAQLEAAEAEKREAWAAVESKAGWEWKKRAEAAEADAARWRFIKAWGRQVEVLGTGECNFGISTPTWRGTWFDLDAAIDAQAATP